MFVKRTAGKRWKLLLGVLGIAAGLAVACLSTGAHAITTPTIPNDFNLQITPSPLVTTVKPGIKTTLELKVRNGGSGTENLKIEPRSFTYDSTTGQINLDDKTTPAVAPWISFSQPRFTIQPGQWITEQITINVPKDAGFSYSFALIISRQSDPKPISGGRLIKGSVAIFTLVNVDRPGAKSTLEVASFSTSKHLYEYLPATFDIRFHNSGNTILQPYGTIFVQRSSKGTDPLAALTVNETKGYILPNTERTIAAKWNGGFASYQPVRQPDGSFKDHLQVDWSQLSHLRIGRYTAHLVAVYSDGQHDVPIEGTITFWVIPWRAILLFVATVTGLWFLGRWRNKRRTEKAVKRALAAQAAANQASQTTASKTEEKTP